MFVGVGDNLRSRQVEHEYETDDVFVTGYSLVSGPSRDAQTQIKGHVYIWPQTKSHRHHRT